MSYTKDGKCTVVVGGGFGSEGKGLAAAWLAIKSQAPHVAVTNAGAQAGHTTVLKDGTKFVTFHLPTIGVMWPTQTVSFVCGGSIIDVDAFFAELDACNMTNAKVLVHPRAAIITDAARAEERDASSSTAKLASTQKGVGATIAAKVMRRAKLAADEPRLERFLGNPDLNEFLQKGMRVTMEVPQGTGLSINHGAAYPHCTSRDCWVASGLSDAGIHPSFLGDVLMVVRTFPIRVGNLLDDDGNVIGESGPFYEGSMELDWARHFPGIEPERTTVTKRVRRIATWSDVQYAHALSLNRPTVVMLNFVNYLDNFSVFLARVEQMKRVHERVGVNPKLVFGVGPKTSDVFETKDEVDVWFRANR